MARKVKTPTTVVFVPQSRDDAAKLIFTIGELQQQRQRLEAELNERLLRLKADYEQEAKSRANRIAALAEGLQVYAAAHRAELTQGGRSKTVKLATGELRWRMTPPRVLLKQVRAVLAALKAAGLARFIRVKEEVDKEAMLREPDAVAGLAGVAIDRREEFVVLPFSTKLEEVAP